MVGRRPPVKSNLLEPPQPSRVHLFIPELSRMMCAVAAGNMEHPRRFRSYQVRENQEINCAIWEAARATTAAPRGFLSRSRVKSQKNSLMPGSSAITQPKRSWKKRGLSSKTIDLWAVFLALAQATQALSGLPSPMHFRRSFLWNSSRCLSRLQPVVRRPPTD